jgi:hypothetical protein
VHYLEENLGAIAVELTTDDLAAIEAIAPKGTFAGERYADMRFVSGVTPTRG